jgi:Mn2+/Fe2+ NRAMP family transporter
MTSDKKENIELNYPDKDWASFLKNHFGPAIMWALLGIGGSHIVLAPTFGGTYGILAIWIYTLVYIIKYGGWELGIRYNYAVGDNLLTGYSRIPGPKNWAVWSLSEKHRPTTWNCSI